MGACVRWLLCGKACILWYRHHPPPPHFQVVRNSSNEVVRWEGGDDTYQAPLSTNVRLRKYWDSSVASQSKAGGPDAVK